MHAYSERALLALGALLVGCVSETALDPAAELAAEDLNSDVATYAAEESVEFAATHYDVQFSLLDSSMRVDAHLHIASDGPCLSIPMKVKPPIAVELDNQTVTLGPQSLQSNRLNVCKPAGSSFVAGSDSIVTVSSRMEPGSATPGTDIGFTAKNVGGAQYSYLLSWVEGCALFGPCDTRTDGFATYRFAVDSDADTQVLCPGKISDTTTIAPSGERIKQTQCLFNFAGGPTYSTFGLIARSKPWAAQSLGTWGDVRATLYYDTEGLRADFEAAKIDRAFAWLTELLGPFPYGQELRFVEAPTEWDGFEHPGTIVLKHGLRKSGRAYANMLEHVVLHELVHQWAGNHVTLASTYDFAWKEAIAEYLSYVYETKSKTEAEALKTPEYWKYEVKFASHYPVPQDPGLETIEFFGAAYGAGTMSMFRQLEAMYGQERIVSAIQGLVRTGMPRTVSVDQVQAALEAAIGLKTDSLDDYFAAWVRGSGTPSQLEVRQIKPVQLKDGRWEVQLTMNGGVRPCAFDVRASDTAKKNQATYRFQSVGGKFQAPAAALTFTPSQFQLDPKSECMIYTTAELKSSRTLPPVLF